MLRGNWKGEDGVGKREVIGSKAGLQSCYRCRQRHRGRGARLRILVREQDAHILDGRDQVILDLLTPEPPPARTFEMMVVSRISKTALDQVLAPSAIAPRGTTVRLSACYI